MVSLYETISYGPFRTAGQTVNASPDFHSSEDELSVGSGNALRSIEWDDGNLKIEHLNTVPLTSIDDTPGNVNADMIPTLASLAHQTYESFLRSQTQKIEKDREVKLKDLENEKRKAIQQLYHDSQQKLHDSEEADMVRQLHSLPEKAKDKLEQRSSQLLERAKAETLVVSNNFTLDKRKVNLNCEQEQQKVLRDRQVFAEFSSAPDSAKDKDALSLCILSGCGNSLLANNLPQQKRCSVPGCTSVLSLVDTQQRIV